MNVAIVCPYDLGRPGGVQDQVIKLDRWLSDLGHEVTVIGPGTEGPENAILLGPTTVVKANASSAPISLNPKVRASIDAAVERSDVVHIHEPLMPTVSLAATRITKKPTVGTFHADPPRWARRGYSAISPVLKKTLSRLDVVTTVSPVSRSAIRSVVDARLIPNGIDLPSYRHDEKIDGRVVFLGRDDARKGLDVLLTAWHEVVDLHPGATLHVVGASRESEIRGVEFLGRVSEDDKIDELSVAEVFVAPNLGGESFGIVVAEGMASGAAVVASGIPAFLYVLGDAGEIVAPGDASGLAQRISDLLTDADRCSAKGLAGLERAKQFSGTRVASMYATAYEDARTLHRS
ncbi:MAG: glycosyltransferase family 4 protein [Acidimicrobiia bacterium]